MYPARLHPVTETHGYAMRRRSNIPGRNSVTSRRFPQRGVLSLKKQRSLSAAHQPNAVAVATREAEVVASVEIHMPRIG